MKRLLPLCLLCSLLAGAQTTPSQQEPTQLATRMSQLMESTAVAVPGLIRASDPIRQNAEMTAAAMQRMPRNPALTWQFMNQVKAYLALSDSIPRPVPFPATADQQFTEMREGLERMRLHFEAILQEQNLSTLKNDADPANLKRYAEADSKMPPASKQPRVVFLGDTITDSWRLNEYFTGRDFVNRGIAGQTTLQMLARFRQDVLSLSPKAVVILAGTNDIAAGIALNQIEDALIEMADLAKAHGIKPVFASVLPVSDYHKDADPAYEMTKSRPPATIEALNRWVQGYCRNSGLVYLDYYSAMADAMGQLKADLSDDGLLPNAKGYRVMSPVTLEAIGRALPAQADQPQDTQTNKRRFKPLDK